MAEKTLAEKWLGMSTAEKDAVKAALLQRRADAEAHAGRNVENDPGAPSRSSDEFQNQGPTPFTTGHATNKSMLQAAFAGAVGSIIPTMVTGLFGREHSFGDWTSKLLTGAFSGAVTNYATDGKSDWKTHAGLGLAAGGAIEMLGGGSPGWKSVVAALVPVILYGLSKHFGSVTDKVFGIGPNDRAPLTPAYAQ